ncbi:unnamed protein product [Staurois parvus]|uniref:Tyrosinase copper-binding domain-containing protein n=1 Tax=Staurois parvus TaxID=386267 RepID=A0ABN9H720_9NEOB|nr:unnamed protein product [Staurois parvus]
MQKCTNNKNFGMPYWEWEKDSECSICTNKYLGSNGFDGKIDSLSVFSEWRQICTITYPQTICVMEDCVCQRPRIVRLAGLSDIVKPDVNDVNYCMTMTNLDTAPYDTSSVNSYRNCLEDIHNSMHVYLGGSMILVPIAANDPLFCCHHANVDRLSTFYYAKYNITPSSYPTGNTRYGHRSFDYPNAFLTTWTNSMLTSPASTTGTIYV